MGRYGPVRERAAIVGEDAAKRLRIEVRPRLRKQGGCASNGRSGSARAVHGPVGGRPVSGRRGLRCHQGDTGGEEVGADAPVEREAARRKRSSTAPGAVPSDARRSERERATVDRMAELNRMKSSFLANVSHELRTPLTAVIGFARTLQSRGTNLSEEERVALAMTGRCCS